MVSGKCPGRISEQGRQRSKKMFPGKWCYSQKGIEYRNVGIIALKIQFKNPVIPIQPGLQHKFIVIVVLTISQRSGTAGSKLNITFLHKYAKQVYLF